MKTTLRLIAFLLCNCFCLAAFALPYGSYLTTCRQCDITVDGTLTCYCPDHFHFWNSSTMYNANQCHSVTNANGNLLCGAFIGSTALGVFKPTYYESAVFTPYEQTCHSCGVYGNNLSCMCLQPNLLYRYTVLQNISTCQAIYNQDGKLMCPPVRILS